MGSRVPVLDQGQGVTSNEWPRSRFIGRSIRRRLVTSHLVAVTASTFVYAAGGFFLLLFILLMLLDYRPEDLTTLVPQFAGVTVFVLVQIGLITLCGVVVARITSRVVAAPILRQIDELGRGAQAVERGDFETKVQVVTDDELGDFATTFNALTSTLGTADRQRKAFVANISHDLRTPIAVIRGHLDMQLEPDSSVEIPAKESFAAIDQELVTLSNLIEDLFTSSRIEEGVLPMTLVPVDVGQIVTESVERVRPYALQTGKVSVHANIGPGNTIATGDATRIGQIAGNLIHNAIRHTPTGGLVMVEVSSPADSAWLSMIVRDTGEGMSAETLARVFDRYYQGEDIGPKGGAGLGLSIVQSLVRLLNGEIRAESVMGEGTAIEVRLPVPANEGQTPAKVPSEQGSKVRGSRWPVRG